MTDSEEVFEDLDKRYRGTLCRITEQHEIDCKISPPSGT